MRRRDYRHSANYPHGKKELTGIVKKTEVGVVSDPKLAKTKLRIKKFFLKIKSIKRWIKKIQLRPVFSPEAILRPVVEARLKKSKSRKKA